MTMRPSLDQVSRILPAPPIELAGFPYCRQGCRTEVRGEGDACAVHGGRPMDLPMLRRRIVRGVRFAVAEIIRCEKCSQIPLNEVRCPGCAWMRGGAMGAAGLAEDLGWEADVEPLIKMIGIHDPGWMEKAWPELWGRA
jgi:hypothetical protein